MRILIRAGCARCHCHSWVELATVVKGGEGCEVKMTACCTALPKTMNDRGVRAGASGGGDDARVRDSGDEDMTASGTPGCRVIGGRSEVVISSE
jgi:hypothetical protein